MAPFSPELDMGLKCYTTFCNNCIKVFKDAISTQINELDEKYIFDKSIIEDKITKYLQNNNLSVTKRIENEITHNINDNKTNFIDSCNYSINDILPIAKKLNNIDALTLTNISNNIISKCKNRGLILEIERCDEKDDQMVTFNNAYMRNKNVTCSCFDIYSIFSNNKNMIPNNGREQGDNDLITDRETYICLNICKHNIDCPVYINNKATIDRNIIINIKENENSVEDKNNKFILNDFDIIDKINRYRAYNTFNLIYLRESDIYFKESLNTENDDDNNNKISDSTLYNIILSLNKATDLNDKENIKDIITQLQKKKTVQYSSTLCIITYLAPLIRKTFKDNISTEETESSNFGRSVKTLDLGSSICDGLFDEERGWMSKYADYYNTKMLSTLFNCKQHTKDISYDETLKYLIGHITLKMNKVNNIIYILKGLVRNVCDRLKELDNKENKENTPDYISIKSDEKLIIESLLCYVSSLNHLQMINIDLGYPLQNENQAN
uniref:Uncharacterized protein n=1 Tax=Trachysalambria curvirostris majanivirus TaxID=2984281 RepID=A0A9C7C6N4_9VIRU|nr:MAG: hypothetical protein [Trachysalambria curvirostris majanivirus]